MSIALIKFHFSETIYSKSLIDVVNHMITFDIRVPCCLQMPLIKVPIYDSMTKIFLQT